MAWQPTATRHGGADVKWRQPHVASRQQRDASQFRALTRQALKASQAGDICRRHACRVGAGVQLGNGGATTGSMHMSFTDSQLHCQRDFGGEARERDAIVFAFEQRMACFLLTGCSIGGNGPL
jgi:hypothetical protein